jgi:hypothetical protein
VDLTLVGVSGGLVTWPGSSNVDLRSFLFPYLDTRYLSVGAGLEMARGPGVSVGTTALCFYEGDGEGSVLPITARLSWDISSEPRWHHSAAYLFATIHHTPYYYSSIPYNPPPFRHAEIGAGVTYTFYLVRARAEFSIQRDPQSGENRATLMAGLDLGGTYGFARTHAE